MTGTIVDRLKGKRRLFLDSAIIIYFIENKPDYSKIVRPIFEMLDEGKAEGISSYITLLEALVQPLKYKRYDLVTSYKSLLADNPSFTLYPVNQIVAERSAEIRAGYSFRTPDAIQLATALTQKAEVFITNDNKLRKCNEIDILILDDFLPHQKKKRK